uniref:Uncharacterized protein n=1 Tax=Oryza punctata TaxID=4537 RepID=A0A0E0L7V0_ORYPU
MLAAGHRASAVRRFPPGCGRDHRAAHPPEQPSPSTTTTNLLRPPPNASVRAATKSPKLARQPLLAVASPGPDRGEGNGLVAGIEVPAAAEVVLVRRPSAVRRYPPECGRGVAVSKPSKEQAALRNGEAKTIAVDGDQRVEVDAGSNGWVNCGGDGGGVRQEEGGGRPWDLTGLMLPPFLPWAQRGRRSQRQKLL